MATLPLEFTVNPQSGNGNGQITITVPEKNKSQIDKIGSFKVKNDQFNIEHTITVKDPGVPPFLAPDQTTIEISHEGGAYYLTGRANLKGLGNYSQSPPEMFVGGLPNYQWRVKETDQWQDLNFGDPVTTLEAWYFRIKLAFAENSTPNDRSGQVSFGSTDPEEVQAITVSIDQSSSGAFLTVTPNNVEINENGDPVTVEVNSNVDWTVEQ